MVDDTGVIVIVGVTIGAIALGTVIYCLVSGKIGSTWTTTDQQEIEEMVTKLSVASSHYYPSNYSVETDDNEFGQRANAVVLNEGDYISSVKPSELSSRVPEVHASKREHEDNQENAKQPETITSSTSVPISAVRSQTPVQASDQTLKPAVVPDARKSETAFDAAVHSLMKKIMLLQETPENAGNVVLALLKPAVFEAMHSRNSKAALLRCCRPAIDVPMSRQLGCYIYKHEDYQEFSEHFAAMASRYHETVVRSRHPEPEWTLPAFLDVSGCNTLLEGATGIFRVSVLRNVAAHPMSLAMTLEDRRRFEDTALKAILMVAASTGNQGTYHSLTPGHSNFVVDVEDTARLIATGSLFPKPGSQFSTPGLPDQVIAASTADWPVGRGCFTSSDGDLIIWVGGPLDHLRIAISSGSHSVRAAVERLQEVVTKLEVELGGYTRSQNLGFHTTHLAAAGTGLKCSLSLQTRPNKDADIGTLADAFRLKVTVPNDRTKPMVVESGAAGLFGKTEAEIVVGVITATGQLISGPSSIRSNADGLYLSSAPQTFDGPHDSLAKFSSISQSSPETKFVQEGNDNNKATTDVAKMRAEKDAAAKAKRLAMQAQWAAEDAAAAAATVAVTSMKSQIKLEDSNDGMFSREAKRDMAKVIQTTGIDDEPKKIGLVNAKNTPVVDDLNMKAPDRPTWMLSDETTREDTDNLLKNMPDGAFFVRRSLKSSSGFCLSYNASGQSVHTLILKDPNNGAFSLTGVTGEFETLADLVSSAERGLLNAARHGANAPLSAAIDYGGPVYATGPIAQKPPTAYSRRPSQKLAVNRFGAFSAIAKKGSVVSGFQLAGGAAKRMKPAGTEYASDLNALDVEFNSAESGLRLAPNDDDE